MKFDVTSREHVRDALGLATASTACTGYHASDDHMSDADLAELRAKGEGPLWYAWSGTKEDSLAVAITGNGPTSHANAKFFACAREVVIALGEEVQRLRVGIAAMAAHHALCAEEDHIRATEPNLQEWQVENHHRKARRDQLVATKLLEIIGTTLPNSPDPKGEP
jgi:hypothetical protein